MKRFYSLFAITALVFSGFALAQNSGSLKVVVSDTQGAPLPGATVLAESVDQISSRTAVSNEKGEARLVGLQPALNYVVTITMSGFGTQKNEGVAVKSGETLTLRISMQASVAEVLTVVSDAPVVDVTKALASQTITLQLTESLPTGRSYQSYLQLVPGVLPDDFAIADGGNPASRSGLNYRDIGGDVGVSRDNFYYIEGINVTDPVQGLFGANLNTEIIQEQKVMTGGIPAEFVGAPGLISNITTKSGGNDFTGSVNYFFQSDALVDSNDNREDSSFDRFDAAFTFGGPIIKDKLWFFTSFRKLERNDDVVAQDTGELLRSVTQDDDQIFAKFSWQATLNDLVALSYFEDPTTFSGRPDQDITNQNDRSRETGGTRYLLKYQHVFGMAVFEASYAKHEGENSQLSVIRETSNSVNFLGGNPLINGVDINTAHDLVDESQGGFGEDILDERNNDAFGVSYEHIFDTSFGEHTLKVGASMESHENLRDRTFIGGASYTSISSANLAGLAAAGLDLNAHNLSTLDWTNTQFDPYNTSDFSGFLNTINNHARRDEFYSLLDANADGTITPEEAARGIVFNSTAGNPNGLINYDRNAQTANGSQLTKSEGKVLYIQDEIRVNDFYFNVGLRAEEWEHKATTGQSIYTFDWEIAPRLSASWDIKGDGTQKVAAYYGRYYDPIRNNMTNFAGSLSGRVREEQVYFADEWIPYRVRGGTVVQDAFFAPTTKTPYTDEIQLTYEIMLAPHMKLTANLIQRETRDILEDYDLGLYALDTSGNTSYPGGLNGSQISDPDSLWLGLDYFGYSENPGSNFVIATLEGGKRDYEGIELIFEKQFSNNWQALASYNHNAFEGNTNSDSNADFQGDVLWLDPRAPNQFGTQPGLIKDLLKVHGSYSWDNGLQVGGSYRWNSGIQLSRTFSASRRNLPNRAAAGEIVFAGITDARWIEDGAVGTLDNPSFGVLDLRLLYNYTFGNIKTEFFVDIFNSLNNQDGIRNQDLVAGSGADAFGDPILFLPPRRYFLGVRLNF